MSNVFDSNCEFEIQINSIGQICLIINGVCDIRKLDEKKITYLEYNNKVLINKKFFEVINGFIIFRNNKSFHQNDDSIRNILYKKLNDFFDENKGNSITFVGGEMYIFGIIFRKYFKETFCFSDYSSIVDDCESNNIPAELVDYTTVVLPKTNTVLFNVSKTGLNENLINNCIENNYINIIIVSCNDTYFFKNNIQLESKYTLIKTIVIETNYLVRLSFFSHINYGYNTFI
jgi:hypothetical protein